MANNNNVKGRILVYGHRGASAVAPENTLSAIALAKRMGADGVEFDVKLTADKKVVLLHDPSVNRTSNGSGLLRDLPFSALRKLDMGGWKAPEFRGEKAPLLAEVFDVFGDDLKLNIEITNYTTPRDGLVDEIVKVIQGSDKKMNLLFSSFFPKNLQRIRILIPNAKTAQLVMPGFSGLGQRLACRNEKLNAIHPHHSDLGKKFIKSAVESGKHVNVWTVNIESDIRKAVLAGINGIITDRPDETRALLLSLKSDQ